eukprot:scaffold515047_cov46-Prasinocladus_malaysianus.AAC.1
MQSLDLTGATGLSDLGVGSLAALPSLTQINLKGCYEVSSIGLANLSGITRLTDLNLEGCGNMDDNALGQLTGLTNLHMLNLSYCGQVSCCKGQWETPISKRSCQSQELTLHSSRPEWLSTDTSY